MRFTKYNNPSKKRRHKKLDYTERSILLAEQALIDSRLGYDIPSEYYTNKLDEKEGAYEQENL